MTTYIFTKTINSDQLTAEIQHSAIVIALDHINTIGTEVDIIFKADLSEDDQTLLTSIVNAHVPTDENTAEIQSDSDGAVMSRIKAAPTGWSYELRGFEITTAKVGAALNNKDQYGVDIGDITVKCFDASHVLVTDPANNGTIVKTCIDFEPPYDYYVNSGQASPLTTIINDVILFVIGVPDYPSSMGGSKPFIQNINFKYIPVGQKLNADGKAAKGLLYNNPGPHTNKIRFMFLHDAGFQMTAQVMIELYKL